MSELNPRLQSDQLTPGVSGDGQFDQAIAPWDEPIELIFDENGEPGFGETAY